MSLVVLVNPRAKGVRRDPGLPDRLASIVGGHGHVLTPTAEALPGVADALARDRTTLVALCGGDGTGQATLTELLRAYRAVGEPHPRLALLRGGTVNTVARNLGITGRPEAILQRLIGRMAEGAPLPTVRQPVLSVNGRVGFLFAAALGARFLELYYEAADPGPARAAWLAAQVVGSALTGGALTDRIFRPAPLELRVDGELPVAMAARLIVTSTVPDVGIGMRIAPRAQTALDRMAIVVSGLSPSEMARQLPAVLAGRALVGAPHVDRLAKSATIEFEENEPYTLDGDLFFARRVELACAGTLSIVRA